MPASCSPGASLSVSCWALRAEASSGLLRCPPLSQPVRDAPPRRLPVTLIHRVHNLTARLSRGAAVRRAEVSQNDNTAVMIQPLVALIAGILILLMPRLLNYVVAST